MAYANAEEVLRLALLMHERRDGVSIDDIMTAFACSRRKAERLRSKVWDLFPYQVEKVDTGERIHRYRLESRALQRLVSFGPKELAAIDTAVKLARREGMKDHVDLLAETASKIRSLMSPEVRNRIAPDLEALTEAEGLAMRPGPRPRINADVVGPLRKAILECKTLRIRYRARGTGKLSWNRLHPYGFLYGNQHFLVAWSLEAEDWRLFRLSRIIEVEILEEPFARDPEFSLKKFAERSFGVFQEEPFKVVWKFAPEVAEDAAEYVFHPNQRQRRLPDGSLLVSFHAGGALEMRWHLYTWGDMVEVLEPEWLRSTCSCQ